eukprot:COSAG06_NODE_4662_length_4056_cov_5.308820_1_plen_182_part_10
MNLTPASMLSCNRWLRRCFAVVGGVRLLSPPPLCEAHAVVALSACDATKASSTLGVGGAPVCTSKNRAYSSSDTRDDSASRAVAVAGRASAAAAAAPPARGWEGFRAVGCSHGAFHRPATHLAGSAGAPAHSSASLRIQHTSASPALLRLARLLLGTDQRTQAAATYTRDARPHARSHRAAP